jgi:4-hydroxy-tetrahydrodipicolinate reductase
MMAEGDAPTAVRVLIHGVTGRMGQEVLRAVDAAPDLAPVGGVDIHIPQASLPLTGGGAMPLFQDVEAAIQACQPRVMVDFTTAAASMAAAERAIPLKVHQVIGTTGLSQEELDILDRLAREHGVGVVAAPNFALGAVLLIHLAGLVARYFDHAEVLEAHHETKIDAPSGTALAIAQALVSGHGGPFVRPEPEKEPVEGSRGAERHGVSIHAMRMPGRMAHHEVVFGAAGQTLTLRHDTINRECYMPGVLTAIRRVVEYKGLVLGLEKILGL